MKMFWQAGRNALARALSAIVSPAVSSASPAPRNGRCTAISRIALAAAAILLLSLGAAHATGTVPTQITLTSSPNPSSAGASVTFTATVTGGNGITGTVDILNEDNSGQVIGSGSVGANGVATINITFNTATVFVLAAGYSGDNTFAPSQSNLISQTVENGIVTTMNASSSPNPSVLGQLVTFTVNITAANGGTPTGVVTFTDQSSNATIPNATLSPAPGGGAMGSTTISSLSVETPQHFCHLRRRWHLCRCAGIDHSNRCQRNTHHDDADVVAKSQLGRPDGDVYRDGYGKRRASNRHGDVFRRDPKRLACHRKSERRHGDLQHQRACGGNARNSGHLLPRCQLRLRHQQRNDQSDRCQRNTHHDDPDVVAKSQHGQPVSDLYGDGDGELRHSDRDSHVSGFGRPHAWHPDAEQQRCGERHHLDAFGWDAPNFSHLQPRGQLHLRR
jgi:hypothetical protein